MPSLFTILRTAAISSQHQFSEIVKNAIVQSNETYSIRTFCRSIQRAASGIRPDAGIATFKRVSRYARSATSKGYRYDRM
jgi:hypothetical protein